MAAVNIPRYSGPDGVVEADRVEMVRDGALWLESGHHVPLDDDLMKSGPSRVGDYWVRKPDGSQTLLAGGEFTPNYSTIPHAYDLPSVSPDIQPGGTPDMPSSGSENLPEPAKPEAIESKQSGDVATDAAAAHAEAPPPPPPPAPPAEPAAE